MLAGKNIEQQNNMGTGDGTKRRIGRWADFPGFGENSWAKAEEDGGWGKKSTRRSFFFFFSNSNAAFLIPGPAKETVGCYCWEKLGVSYSHCLA